MAPATKPPCRYCGGPLPKGHRAVCAARGCRYRLYSSKWLAEGRGDARPCCPDCGALLSPHNRTGHCPKCRRKRRERRERPKKLLGGSHYGESLREAKAPPERLDALAARAAAGLPLFGRRREDGPRARREYGHEYPHRHP